MKYTIEFDSDGIDDPQECVVTREMDGVEEKFTAKVPVSYLEKLMCIEAFKQKR